MGMLKTRQKFTAANNAGNWEPESLQKSVRGGELGRETSKYVGFLQK